MGNLGLIAYPCFRVKKLPYVWRITNPITIIRQSSQFLYSSHKLN